MSEDKKILFMPMDHEISETDKSILREVGYEIIQVTDPSALVNGLVIPMTPMVLPHDKISFLMLKALQKYKPARDDFSQSLITEMLRQKP